MDGRIPAPPLRVDAPAVTRAPARPARGRTPGTYAETAGLAGAPDIPDFSRTLVEAAEALSPDVALENSRRSIQQLLSQTAAMNLLAAAPNDWAALQPAALNYAAHIANQVQLESNAPVRFRDGDRFRDRDRADGHVRVPPVNESRDSPEITGR